MNGNKLFLDTNIILYLLDGDETLAELLNDKQLYISLITELELLAFKGITEVEEQVIKSFVSQCKVISINSPILLLNFIFRLLFEYSSDATPGSFDITLI